MLSESPIESKKINKHFEINDSFFNKCCYKELTSLTLLEFVTFEMLQEIIQCEHLTELRINSSQLASTDFHCLKNLKQLKKLNLSETSIKDVALISILKNNCNLEHLIIDHCGYIQNLDRIVSTVTEYNTNLKTFSHMGVGRTFLTVSGFRYISFCLNLKKLSLKFCLGSFEQCGFEHISLKCPHLEEVQIWGWNDIDDLGLLLVLGDLKNLKNLSVCYNRLITPNFPKLAYEWFSRLEIVTVGVKPFSNKMKLEWTKKYPGGLAKNILK